MVRVPVEGADGVKTTMGVKRYVWKCDINRQGRKMMQTSLSAFLTVRTPENGNSLNDSVGEVITCDSKS